MIKIENVEVVGLDHAIRGMRNPKNSHDRSDSSWTYEKENIYDGCSYTVGHNDHKLMRSLAKGGPVHAKYRRMIAVYMDITAPLYWWKEFDTYKVGTVANSCSTMHKIHERDLTIDDFSHEHLTNNIPSAFNENVLKSIINVININRRFYKETGDKTYWWQMIQLLPSSYNQRRTIMLNYEVLTNIYHSRKDHKLDEWREFCKFIETLPYSDVIVGYTQEILEQLRSELKENVNATILD